MTTFTMKSPTTGGDLPTGVTAVGGIVLDLIGLNGVRVLVQIPAAQLFEGVFDEAEYGGVGPIGVLGGLSPQVLAQLGGGLSEMAVRMTVHDGDTSVGDWDYNQNFLMMNGVELGNLSTQQTQATGQDGTPSGMATGFQNGALSTGWFHVTDSARLAQIFSSFQQTNQAAFGLRDLSPGDNGYDFTQGLNGSYFGVTAPNAAPDAHDDAMTVSKNGALVISAEMLTANDVDPEGATLSATIVTQPAHGTITMENGLFVYRPNPGYTGSDSFTYRASDGALGDVATVNLTVNPTVAPTPGADAYSTERGSVLTVSAAEGVLANDSDPDGSGDLTVSLFSGPRNGTLQLNDDGSFIYTPRFGFHGTDSFIYLVTDEDGEISSQVVTLTVANNNAAPVAGADSYEVDRNGSLVVTPADGVLRNDSDPDGDSLTVLLAGPPAHGSLTMNPDGSFTYTPHFGYHGPDSFSYLVRDPSGDEALATVSLTVRLPNTAPVAVDDVAYQVNEDGSLSVDAAEGVLANDSDPDGSPLTAQLRTNPANGRVTLAADGSFVYVPNPGFVGTDSFTYIANDGSDGSYATVTLTVNAVNHAPVGSADAYAMEAGATFTVDAARGVLANDSDPDGDTLTAVLLQGPRNGQFALNADGSFTYTPDAGFSGEDVFTYSLRDGTTTVPVTVTLTVNPRQGRVITLDGAANRVSYARDAEAVIVHALGGNDSITGSRFDDELLLGDGNDEGIGGDGNDIIRGGAGNDKMFGQGGADRLDGGDGDDLMHGGDGADIMIGGRGDDTYYVHSADDQVIENAGEGNDNVRSTVSWVLGDNFEELLLEGMANIDGTGNARDNTVLGNNANNTLYGLDGNDTLGGYGGDDILFGGAGNDRLVGRDGNDVLHGGTGDDQYFVDTRDVIVEGAGEGYDVVFSVGDYKLGDNLEVLRLDGTGDLRGEGNDLDNYIAGTSGHNLLIGGGGADQIFGGSGDDVLFGDGGLAAGNDRLDGGDGNDRLHGGSGDDTLSGGAGDDVLFGESGTDRLDGGRGDDVFSFDRLHLEGEDGRWDTISDFHGAGTSGVGEQDRLSFSGFGSNATVVFDHYGANQSQQFYRVIDPDNPAASRLILVQMAGSNHHLTVDDYIFHAS